MDETAPAPHPLLSRSVKLRLFLMLRKTVDKDDLRRRLDAHLGWIIEQERSGRIFLSGPVAAKAGPQALNGLTVLRAADADEAQRIGQEDPLVKAGAVTFEMFEWIVNEGAMSLSITLSDSSIAFL